MRQPIAKEFNLVEQKLFKALADIGARCFLTQQPIKISEDRGYRADFLFYSVDPGLVVEVDGEFWHNRTVGQRKKTEVKREDLEAKGLKVLTFTDKEVNKDALGVAGKVLEELKRLWKAMPFKNEFYKPWKEESSYVT